MTTAQVLSDDKAKTIFAPFLHLDVSRNRNSGGYGYGLGLGIVKDVIDRHSGTIGLTKSVNGGAYFEITLPIKACA